MAVDDVHQLPPLRVQVVIEHQELDAHATGSTGGDPAAQFVCVAG
ncbi:MAG: hypothetical protein R2789_00680 [Microthrixaceae bacterium]